MKPHSFLRILLVDDEPEGARLLALLLKHRGHAVEVAHDGASCLAALEAFQPEVVLLDLAMPLVSGYEVARKIREQSEFDHVAIFAVSGYGGIKYEARSIYSGCERHFVKPVDLPELDAALAEVLRRRNRLDGDGRPNGASSDGDGRSDGVGTSDGDGTPSAAGRRGGRRSQEDPVREQRP